MRIGYQDVIRRIPINGRMATIARGDTAITIPRKWVETLACGCQRIVKVRQNSSCGAHAVSLSYHRVAIPFDAVKSLKPETRVCSEHPNRPAPPAEREIQLAFARRVHVSLRLRAKERGLSFP